MDGVSSAFAVVSLAIQLVDAGEKISKFLSSVQDAPSEIVKLGQTLDQLNSTLKQVSYLLEQQYMVLRLPGSPVFITNALENCERRIKTLDYVIRKVQTSMDHGNRVQRSWAAMRFVSKKEDIQEMQCQLRDAEAGLQTAMLSNSWQLQMHHISVSSSGGVQATTIEETSLTAPTMSVTRHEQMQTPLSTPKDVVLTTAKETSLVWYNGFFGRVNIHSKSKCFSRSNTRRPGVKATSSEKIITITPIFLRKTLELRFLDSFGRISRSLSTYPILDRDAPIFRICEQGDLQGLRVALSSGGVSPFLETEDGWSLLHYAARGQHPEVCAVLLQLGVDSNRTCMHGYKPMTIAAANCRDRSEEDIIDTLRLLTQSQSDISSRDIFDFWSSYEGPVEGAEFAFSQDLIQSEYDISDGDELYPHLATALRVYGADPSQPEDILRLLLRKGVGLHSPVPRNWGVEDLNEHLISIYPCEVLEYGTPLDDLFSYTETPFEGEEAADRWLQILSSEGHDVMAYLEEESKLHAAQEQLTFPCAGYYLLAYDVPRRLVYRRGMNPPVSWDWWIDPKSSTYLVREEFKHMAILGNNYDLHFLGWKGQWPLRYPAWSDHYYYYEDEIARSNRKLLQKRAHERANRRMEKKLREAARAQEIKERHGMPGAWPV